MQRMEGLSPEEFRVLLIDDDPWVEQLVHKTLAGQPGFGLHVVQHLDQAMEAVERYLPNLILIELMTAGGDGFQLLAQFSEHPLIRDLPVIVLSWRRSAPGKARAFSLGVDDYLVKPVEAEELLARLRRHLAIHEARVHLHRAETRYRNLFEHSLDAILLVDDRSGRIVDCNPAACRLLARGREKLLATPLPSLLRPDQPQDRKSWPGNPKVGSGMPAEPGGFLFLVNGHGKSVPVDVAVSAFTHGEEHFLQYIFRDATERLRIEERNRRNLQARLTISALLRTALAPLSLEAQLKVALDLVLSAPWISIESRGSLFLVEEESGDLIMIAQRGLEEPVITACRRVRAGYCLCGRASLGEEILFVSNLGPGHDMHYEGIRDHGHYCVPIGSSKGVLGVLNLYLAPGHVQQAEEEEFLRTVAQTLAGLIDRKRVDEALQRAKDAAESANQAKTRFLANVSHEIRTPLNAILGFAQILIKHREQFPTRFRQYLENILVSGENLVEIINNVLDLAKIEAGKLHVDLEDIDPRLLLQSIFHVHKEQAARKGVLMNYGLGPDVPRLVRSDRTRINQILTNLLENAIKFTPSGRRVEVGIFRDDREILLMVADQGIGIPPDKQALIFEPFEQADGSTTRLYGGTGLGLSIVKSLTALLGGTVALVSAEGQGATFTVRLPLIEPDAREEAESQPDWNSFRFPPETRLLLVEDNPLSRDMLLAALQEVGLTPAVAENGAQCLEMVAHVHPDLIIMDLHMPVMDGLTATRRLRNTNLGREIPIIGISADAFIEKQNEAKEAGMSDFLTKPVDLFRLMPAMARLLHHRHAESPPDPAKPLLPLELRKTAMAELRAIAKLPLFQSRSIVVRCEAVIEMCDPYASPLVDIADRIRQAVYSRHSSRIPDIVREGEAWENEINRASTGEKPGGEP
ncbi:MAG: response regulator [Magnetococcales bacterium]|nr:response regulator [Magnetococcales bacterium]